MDFYQLTSDKYSYNNVFVNVDYLSKMCFILFYKKMFTIKKIIELYYYYIYYIYGIFIIIICN